MPPSRRVDEHHIVALGRRVRHRVLCDRRGVLAVPLLVKLDVATLAGCQLLEIPHMHGELLNGTGAEGVARRDEDPVLVLQEEVADLGEVRGFANTVDPDYGHDVGSPGLA